MNNDEAKLEEKLRTMRILWGAFLMAIVMFAVLTLVTPGGRAEADNASVVFLVLLAVALSLTASSFMVKKIMLARSERERSPEAVQSALVVALVLCESAVILGLISHFITGQPLTFVLFVIGAVGELAHFPRRDHLRATTYKRL